MWKHSWIQVLYIYLIDIKLMKKSADLFEGNLKKTYYFRLTYACQQKSSFHV